MDDSFKLEAVIDQADMSSDCDIFVTARRRRQLALQVVRYGVHLPAQIPVERRALTQARFLIGRQAILAPEPCRCVGLVLVGPVASDLSVVVVKAGIFAVLGKSPSAGEPEQRNC